MKLKNFIEVTLFIDEEDTITRKKNLININHIVRVQNSRIWLIDGSNFLVEEYEYDIHKRIYESQNLELLQN